MSRDLSFQRAIEFAADLIRIPSPPGGEGEVAERVRREMEALGFDDVWIDDVGNAIGRVRGRGEATAVMLSSHLDVVDPGDPATWKHPPYGGVIADGFLHGRGAMDIKGPLAIQTYAAARFLEARPGGDIIVAHTVLEERGGWGMEHLLAAGEVRPGAVIIGEATAGDICIGHRGRAEIEVRLVGRAGHASAPERARNAIAGLPSVVAAILEFADDLGSDPVLGPSTLAPTDVATRPSSPNVIPDTAIVTVDWRVLPQWRADDVLARLRDHLVARAALPEGVTLDVRFGRERQTTHTGLTRDRPLFTPGFLLAPDHPLARAAAGAVRDVTGREPAIRPWTFATDGGHTCGESGIPTIGFAPGEERFAHTNRERLALDAASAAYDLYPAIVRAAFAAVR